MRERERERERERRERQALLINKIQHSTNTPIETVNTVVPTARHELDD